uniref:Urea ABC transporter ATP-binding subunit UrtE n=1 Tax=OCS116 cluster bacterium TaxID=2030921 RepID=A0A2A4Z9Z3_9PROT
MLQVNQIDVFYSAAQAVRGASLTAELGKVTCLLGRNGVGKTTMLKAITGQMPIAKGSIIFDDNDISKLPADERARLGIGYIPQGREIFPLLTVKENLQTGFGAVTKSERYISDEIYELFPVLKQMLSRRGGDLSGGQQQQLAIARALIMQPKLLVLDEPTEGIQPSVIKDIGRVIAYLRDKGDMAILLVEQYFDFAHDLADHFIVMDRGSVIVDQTFDEANAEEIKAHLTV